MAQHSLLVEAIATHRGLAGQWRLAALLHDGPEYVVGDLITPFKAVVGSSYRDLEARLSRAIRIRFGPPATLPARDLTNAIDFSSNFAQRVLFFLAPITDDLTES